MDPYRYIKRIVFEAKNEQARPVEMEIKRDGPFFTDERFLFHPESLPPAATYVRLGMWLSDWHIKWQTDQREDFKKVADIVGEEKAIQVLKALGK